MFTVNNIVITEKKEETVNRDGARQQTVSNETPLSAINQVYLRKCRLLDCPVQLREPRIFLVVILPGIETSAYENRYR